MKFTIKAAVLRDALIKTTGHLKKAETIPVLTYIHLESVGESSLRIVGTNLDVAVRAEVEADIQTSGVACAPGIRLLDIVRTLTEDISISIEDNDWINVKSGSAKFRLPAVSPEQFPETPFLVKKDISVPAKILRDFIRLTSFAITTDISRFTLNGAKLEISPESLRMVTTDQHRLALAHADIQTGGEVSCLIPKLALDRISRIIDPRDEDIKIGEDQHHIFLEQGNWTMAARKLSGSFPTYEMVLPKDLDNAITLDAKRFGEALNRTTLIANSDPADLKKGHIAVNLTKGGIEIAANAGQEGEGGDAFNAEYQGEDITLKYQGRYVRQFLDVALGMDIEDGDIITPSVVISFTDAMSPSEFTVPQGMNYQYRYILMPLR